MSADPFTEAARVEALRAWVKESDRMDSIGTLGAHMAEWARDRLTTQEATDAEARVGRLENRAASETARANAWRGKHRIMAGKRDAAHRAYQAEREARREAEARIKAVQDVLDNIDTSNDPALHDGFADVLRALDG